MTSDLWYELKGWFVVHYQPLMTSKSSVAEQNGGVVEVGVASHRNNSAFAVRAGVYSSQPHANLCRPL